MTAPLSLSWNHVLHRCIGSAVKTSHNRALTRSNLLEIGKGILLESWLFLPCCTRLVVKPLYTVDNVIAICKKKIFEVRTLPR